MRSGGPENEVKSESGVVFLGRGRKPLPTS